MAPVLIPFDMTTLHARGLQSLVLDVVAGTLELRFADHVEVWQRVADLDTARGALVLFHGEAYVGPRERESA